MYIELFSISLSYTCLLSHALIASVILGLYEIYCYIECWKLLVKNCASVTYFYEYVLNKSNKSRSFVSDSVTPWTVAYQAPLSMAFSRQECWSGLPFPSPGDLPNPGIEPRSPTLQADALPSEPPGKPPNLWQMYILSYESHSVSFSKKYN